LALLLLSHSYEPGEPDKRPPVDASLTADEVWKARCGACHGEGGEGSAKKKVPDMRAAAWQEKHDDALIRSVIENGIKGSKMRGYQGKLSGEQLDGLIAKIRGIKK
jgi:mono/diheme cytochrome c family protein